MNNLIGKNRYTKPAVLLGMSLATLVAAPAVQAAVICSANNLGITVPATTSGIYLNLATGATATSGTGFNGWNFNPWGSSTLGFYYSGTSGGTTTQKGGVGTGAITTGNFSVLSAGEPIGPSQQFNTTTGGGTNWQTALTDVYYGLRFLNSVTSTVNYGWIRMSTSAPTGVPATINQYCYDDSGAEIAAGTTPVSLQQFSID